MVSNALVIFYHKKNKFSFNALLGSIEKNEKILKNFKFYFFKNIKSLLNSLDEITERHERIIVCFSLLTPQIFEIEEIIVFLKKKYKNNLILIAGGSHPTGLPKETLDMGFDYVFRYEAEQSFPEFLLKIIDRDDINMVKGIFYKKENGYVFTGKPDFVEIDKFPPFSQKFYKFGPIEITRGCPFVCYYCQTPHIFGVKPRHRSIESVLKYVEILKKYRKTDIRFITPSALGYGSEDGKKLNLEAVYNLLKGIRNILKDEGRIFFGSFPSEVRPEHINEESIRILKKFVNNKNIVIGAQTGSDSLLKKINRGHTVQDIRNAVKIAKKAGFEVNVDFIFGLPYETEEDIELSIELMKELIEMGVRIHAHTFMPLPQTPFFDKNPEKVTGNL